MENPQVLSIEQLCKEVQIPEALIAPIVRMCTAFAKEHVKAALAAASKTDYVLDSSTAQEDILNCYPLDNIK